MWGIVCAIMDCKTSLSPLLKEMKEAIKAMQQDERIAYCEAQVDKLEKNR